MTDHDRTPLSSVDRSIDRFISGEMLEDERAAFEARLVNDPEAAELLEAERLIQAHQYNAVRSAGAGVALPNVLLLQHLLKTRPQKRWPLYLLAGLFALMLVGVLYLTATYSKRAYQLPKATVVADSSKPTPVQRPTLMQTPAEPTVRSTQTAAAKSTANDSIHPKPSPAEIEEPHGPMKVFTNDKVPMKIHSN